MENNELFDFYKFALQGVLTNPLCADYKNEWRQCGTDKEKLVTLAMRQQSIPYLVTHCYNGKGLSKEYILKEFADYINGKRQILDADGVADYTYSLYVAFDGILKADSDVLACMWCNSTSIEIDAAKCPVIYIACGSQVHLCLNGYNAPRIYLFDDSKVFIDDADETCSVTIYNYSGKAGCVIGKYCTTNNIKEFQKELRL